MILENSTDDLHIFLQGSVAGRGVGVPATPKPVGPRTLPLLAEGDVPPMAGTQDVQEQGGVEFHIYKIPAPRLISFLAAGCSTLGS